jgi:hypothetical protein
MHLVVQNIHLLMEETTNLTPFTCRPPMTRAKKNLPYFMLRKFRRYHKTPQNFRDVTLELLP